MSNNVMLAKNLKELGKIQTETLPRGQNARLTAIDGNMPDRSINILNWNFVTANTARAWGC